MIVGRLIPAGTGSVMNNFRRVAADRDKILGEEKKMSVIVDDSISGDEVVAEAGE